MNRAWAAAVCVMIAACGGGTGPSAPAPGGACAASMEPTADGPPWTPPADPASPVHVTFTATIDTQNAALTSAWVQPHPEAISIQGGAGGLRLWGGVKPYALHPGRLWVELYVIDDGLQGVRGATATVSNVSGSTTFYDLTYDPWAAPSASPTPLTLGGIAPRGVSGHLRFGFDVDASSDPITFTLAIDGTTTTRTSTSSSPIAVTPDGEQVWSTLADADVVSVLDTETDTRIAQVGVGTRPTSVAVTPDGALVLVASAGCNQLEVIDRATRAPVQIFAEGDGIGREPRNVVISPDGTRAYVSAYVSDTVTVLQRFGDRFRVVGSVPVGRRPTGMSVTPDGSTLMVAHYMPRGPLEANGGWISLVATDTLAVANEAPILDDGNDQFAACLTGITGFSQYTASDLHTEGTPTQLAGIFLDPSGAVGWVPGLRVAPFPIFEGNVQTIGLPFLDLGANSPASMFPIDARAPRSAQLMRLPSVIDITDRQESFLQCEPFMEEVEAVTAFPVQGSPGQVQSPGTILPSGATPLSETGVSRFVAFTAGGRRAISLSYVADELMVLDAATHAPTTQRYTLLPGSNPVGMAVTPDGKKGYVAYDNSTFVSVLDLSAYAGPSLPVPSFLPYQLVPAAPGTGANIVTFSVLQRDTTGVPDLPALHAIAQVPVVDADPLPPATRRGKVLFSSSSPVKYPTLSGNREASCSSCHPNGGNDGSVWGTMEGERRTIALWGGTAGRGWLHWSATHVDSRVFATTIVQQRLGGTGLSTSDVEALSEYVAHGIPRLQTPVVDGSLASTGKAYFGQHCTSCHQGSALTSGSPDPASPLGGGQAVGPQMQDVGSATSWAGATLGAPFTNLFPPQAKTILSDLRGDRALGAGDPVQQTLQFTARPDRPRGAFKAPSLVNVWDSPLFFHDGRADTLDGAVRDMAMRLGLTPTDDEVSALVEYLKTL